MPTGDDESVGWRGTFKGTLVRNGVDVAKSWSIEDVADIVDSEEGTPEDIRRRLFSHLPSTNASLDCTPLAPTVSNSDPSASNSFNDQPRIDL